MGLRGASRVWGVRFDVFVSGAVVMGLEVVGSRLLAPSFGDSVFVWGSLIGVVMAALAAGYYLGGRLADRSPSFRTLSLIILFAGIFTLLIPSSASYVMEAVLNSGLGDRYGPLVSTTLLLGLPTGLLGMVSPYAIRLSTRSLVEVGGTSGSLYSISTGGSIFGTFFTVFALIPSFGVRAIILSLGLVLVAASFIGLAWFERGLFVVVVGLILLPPTLLSGPLSVSGGRVLLRRETPYSTLTVVDKEDRGIRVLYLNNMPHSAMYLNGSNEAAFRYTDYFNMGFAFNPAIDSVLFIGGGGFSGPKQFLEYYPGASIDVVEIDPDVVRVAREYFGVPEDPRLRVFVEDGRAFLGGAGRYDLIVLDAYSKSYVPFHLMTLEFFEALEEHLNPGGVIVSNLISSFIGDTSDLMRAEYRTVGRVFPQLYIFHTKVGSQSAVQNLILVATKDQTRYDADDLAERVMDAPKRGETLAVYSKTLFSMDVRTEDVPVLTDDYAPAESLLNPVTMAPYEGGEELLARSALNPLFIAGAWVLALASIYATSSLVRLRFKIGGVTGRREEA